MKADFLRKRTPWISSNTVSSWDRDSKTGFRQVDSQCKQVDRTNEILLKNWQNRSVTSCDRYVECHQFLYRTEKDLRRPGLAYFYVLNFGSSLTFGQLVFRGMVDKNKWLIGIYFHLINDEIFLLIHTIKNYKLPNEIPILIYKSYFLKQNSWSIASNKK